MSQPRQFKKNSTSDNHLLINLWQNRSAKFMTFMKLDVNNAKEFAKKLWNKKN